ncbi:AI-2E family transporter [Sediminibacillus albus]|uniref:Predicted PurR-regulated permease PerM n=1 Tax=Sediminibacillus albus TaxID=407036 RepID=A0A1G8ZRK9_9BACI|nr:AI-2E family transporter [Sediminibacillus albus]SDK16955.1 Predicted PurR-regulated permease PerM [Sediminibacillus albus]
MRLLEKKSVQGLVIAILIFMLIYLISITKFIFVPIGAYLISIAVPIIGAGLLYYITMPLVRRLEKWKVHRILAIIIVFFIIIGVIYFMANFIAPIVQQQFTKLTDNIPKMVDNSEKFIYNWRDNQDMIPSQLDSTIENITNNLNDYAQNIVGFLIDFLAQVFGFLFAFVLIPFFLFFMLKDGHKFVPFISKFLSKSKADSFRRLADNINHTLASFIQGQFIVSVCVGFMLYIGYLIIGLQYSLTLALFGLIMNFIPFVGPFLSAIPAIIVGFFEDPMLAVWAILVMVIAQQIESNLISPNIMGKVLELHPLTIITLILAAGSIAGFLGLLFIIPAYAVVKTIISHFYHEWRKKQPPEDQNIF